MRLRIALVAVLAFVIQAQGAPVSPSEAASAVRGWAASGEHLGIDFKDRLNLSSGAVETTAVHTASSGAIFYTVKFRNGCGTVFLSGDTELEPVISFTASPRDYSARDGSPLWILLDGDISTRKAVDGAADKWRRYLAADPEKPRLRAAPLATEPSDLRVAPLVKSEWGQGDGIYNYCTTNNYPCGCVATMMAQIMRYHHGPDGGRGIPLPKVDTETEFTNYVTLVEEEKGESVTNQHLFTSKLMGGYDWEQMPLVADGLEDVQKENIGKLTRDCGISVGMDYSEGGSEAVSANTVQSFIKAFGYSQAIWSSTPDVDNSIADEAERARDLAEKTKKFYQRTLYANFDAGFPCELSISKVTDDGDYTYRENGHAVVADGYGFDGENKIPYVHLNMGWSGADDFWYNLPDIGTKYEFNTVDGVGFNIFPVEGGLGSWGQQPTYSILSGRVLDDEGAPKGDCKVTIYEPGTLNVVTTLTTNAKGIWAAILPNGWLDGLDKATYDVAAATDDMAWYKMVEGVELERANVGYNEYYICGPDSCGNSWGNDLVLEHPSVRVGDQVFSTVDNGIIMARMKAEESEGPVAIEVLDTTWLKRCALIDFNCVLFATNLAPRESAVTRLFDEDAGGDGRYAMLTVADGYSLVMSNIVFAAEKGAGTIVDVKEGGSLDIVGTIEFGVSYTNAAVKTANANGLRLLGPIGDYSGFTLSCATATNDGQALGFCRAADDAELQALSNSVPHIANFADKTGESRASVQDIGDDSPPNYKLVWKSQPVPFEDAVAYYVDKDGKTNTAGRIDVLLDKYVEALADGDLPDDRKIGVRKDDTLSRPLVIGSDSLSIVGEGVEVSVEQSAGFTVTGGVLSASGISLCNYAGNALFLVNGEGAKLSISNVVFSAIEGTNKWSGAVTILKGSATIGDARFTSCKATGKFSTVRNPIPSYGGAIYVGSGSSLDLRNSVIMGCNALMQGGAIFADTNAVVKIGGELWICQNTEKSGTQLTNSDIFLRNVTDKVSCSRNRATLQLVEPVINSKVVGVCWYKNEGDGGYGNTNRCLFAVADSDEIAEGSVDAFFSDLYPSLVAEAVVEADGAMLRWSEPPEGPQPLVPTSPGEIPAGARAGVVGEGGAVTNYYASVAGAITVAKEGETVVVLVDATFSSDISVSANIELTSDGHKLTRAGDCSIVVGSGASLTLADIEIVGSSDEMTTNEMTTKKPLFDVRGGSLTLAAGAKICDVNGDGARNAGAVSVGDGTFAMESGAVISNCVNRYVDEADGSGRGGALLVDNGEAVFTGGTITGCAANNGGGVFAGNDTVVRVSGDTVISGNTNLGIPAKANNLVVYDKSKDIGYLVLDGKLTGSIGYTEGLSGDTNVFGSVSDYVSSRDALDSAANFTHDATGDTGKAVQGESGRLLVWSSALDDSGRYDTGGDEAAAYVLIGHPQPIDFSALESDDGTAWKISVTGVVELCWYSLYETNSLSGGFLIDGMNPKKRCQATTNDVPTMMFERPRDGERLFWRVKAEDEDAHAWPDDEITD